MKFLTWPAFLACPLCKKGIAGEYLPKNGEVNVRHPDTDCELSGTRWTLEPFEVEMKQIEAVEA